MRGRGELRRAPRQLAAGDDHALPLPCEPRGSRQPRVEWGTSDVIYSREINNGGPVWEQGRVWVEQNPIRYMAQFKTPTLVTIGEQDFRVPLNNSLEYWSALQRQQVPSRLVVFPDENHWILKGENSKLFYQEIHDWLARWLGPQPPPK